MPRCGGGPTVRHVHACGRTRRCGVAQWCVAGARGARLARLLPHAVQRAPRQARRRGVTNAWN
eukprot:702231-Prymnesium_polylepis.1